MTNRRLDAWCGPGAWAGCRGPLDPPGRITGAGQTPRRTDLLSPRRSAQRMDRHRASRIVRRVACRAGVNSVSAVLCWLPGDAARCNSDATRERDDAGALVRYGLHETLLFGRVVSDLRSGAPVDRIRIIRD
jgi:hypothetical protein